MKIVLTFLISIFIFLIFCSRENSPISSNMDKSLERQLIGKWQAGRAYKLDFKENNIYLDSTYTDWNSAGFELLKVITGTYNIVDGIVYVKNTRYVFIDTSKFFYQTYTSFNRPYRVILNDEELILKYVDILNPIDHPGLELNGKWENDWWVNICQKSSPLIFSEGILRFSYIFLECLFLASPVLVLSQVFGKPSL